MNHFKSDAKEVFGITCKEASKKGLIQRGTALRNGKVVSDGYECIATGNNYPTQFDALAAHFRRVNEIKQERKDTEDKSLKLFAKYKGQIEKAGFLSDNLFSTRTKIFEWERYVWALRDNGEVPESEVEDVITAYEGMIMSIKIKNRKSA